MTWPNITSGSEYIAYGANWTDGSGSFALVNDISFSAQMLNDVATGNLYTGFNATFEGNNFTITIEKYGGAASELNHALIKDLSGGTIQNMTIDVSGLGINYGAPHGETGVLVMHSPSFNIGISNNGAFGSFYYLTINFTNSHMINPGNSALLPKFFGANNAGDVYMDYITLNGTLTAAPNSDDCGIIGTEMFHKFTQLATIEHIVNNIKLNNGLSIFGSNFCKNINGGDIEIFDTVNNGDISNNTASIVGSIIGKNAFIDASSSFVVINYVENNGKICQNNIGGIIGGNMAQNSKSDLEIIFRDCKNTGIINGDNCGGLIGLYANKNGAANILVIDCSNSGVIYGINCGGIIGYNANESASGKIDISGCINYGDISNNDSAGIVGPSAGKSQTASGEVIIRGCNNNGHIYGINCGGIVGYNANESAVGKTTITGCINYGDISSDDSAGIVGPSAGKLQTETGEVIIHGCDNSGVIYTVNCSGIVGYNANESASGKIDISGCTNYGDISNNDSAGIVGFLAGYKQKKDGIITIHGCDNSGIIIGTESAGIVGKNANQEAASTGTLNIFNCNNYSDISGLSSAGIVGTSLNQDSSGVVDISNCKNYGNILAASSAGIVGYQAGYKQNSTGIITIRGCDNSGIIIGTESAGIVGKNANYQADASGTVNVFNCNNYRDISGSSSAGIVGNYLNIDSSGTVDISNCKNYGNINNDFSAGIVGNFAGSAQYKDGIITISECDNYANIYGPSSTGILGDSANAGSSGEVVVSHCVNYGGLFGKDTNFNIFYTDEYPYFNDFTYYAASSGIVGPSCGKGMAPAGNILIENCDNSGSFNAPYTSGITSFGLGIDSSGTIDISGCTNYAKLQYTGCAGISAGLIGINNTGTITFNNCANYGDISGVGLNKIETGCLIHSIGYVNSSGDETSGEINIINCVNDNSWYNEELYVGGIIGTIYLSATKQINIDISNCENTINNVNVPSNCCIGGICFGIADGYVGSTANNTISIHNCIANPLTQAAGDNNFDCKILFTLASPSFCNTPCTLNIYENTIDCGDIITSTFYISILCFIDNTAMIGLLNKNINIYANDITVNDISNAPAASMILAVKALENCAIDICNNTVSINSITGNSLSVSGILSEGVEYLKNVDMLIRNNTIEINNIDPSTTNVAGLIRVTTTNTSFFDTFIGTFSNCDNFNLTITGNEISSNTLDVLIDGTKGNAGLIGTNTDIDPTGSTYRGPTGTLILADNAINSNVYGDDYTDYYFQPNFRPYIYVVAEYPESNYWFNDRPVNVPRQIGSNTDDTALRQIFKRAIKAINEQTQFEIYPFYQIKVKAKKM